MKRWEMALGIALCAALLWQSVFPSPLLRWWSVAFAPLCERIGASGDAEIEVRCGLLALFGL